MFRRLFPPTSLDGCLLYAHELDRVNEFSDEDEEIEFSSGEYDPNNIGRNGSGNGAGISGDHLTGYDAKRGYACKRDMRKYRKIDQTENDGEVDDGALGVNPADSDSEFENLKVKGSSRAKISHVSISLFLLLFDIRLWKSIAI